MFSSFFEPGFASRGKARPSKGEDLHAEITISFEEAFHGGKKIFEVTKEEICGVCKGSGAKPGTKSIACPECNGRGTVALGQGAFAISRVCPRCYGKGNIISTPCEGCKGIGTKPEMKRISINIPQGINDGGTLRIPGQGQPGPAGGQPGDLLLTIHLEKHAHFKRAGHNIHSQMTINLAQAMLGTTLKVSSLDGSVALRIPPGTQTGTTFRLKGRGFAKPDGSKGDQLVEVKVSIPKDLTSKQKELIEQFAQEANLKY